MRRSSPSLQFLAAATSTDANMSFRPSFRRGWNQKPRGFSDRPFCEGGEPFVTGDSHFQSVSDANRGFRPAGGNFSSGGSYGPQHRPAFNPPPHFHPFNPSPQFNPSNPPPPFNPQFNPSNPPPPFNPRPQSDHPPHLNPWPPSDSPPPLNRPWPPSDPPPPCNQHQQFRPAFIPYQPFRPAQQFRPRPPKPLDYRNWEFANSVPPPHSERFTVLSYNILADSLATSHRHKLYFHIPHHILSWDWRKRNIIFELGLWSADILCFQEVDRFQDLEAELKLRGYSGIWKMRTGNPVDGCAIFWHISRFKLLHEECIEFNKLGLRDNVAQICVLKSVHQHGSNSLSALPIGSTGSNKVVICNIHVLYNPKRGDIKLGQIRLLLERAYAVSKLWDGAPVVLCGDFNCTPKSPLYNYIAEQKLNLSDLPRDKISGQASAEIRAPGQFGPYAGPQSVHNSVRAPALTDGRNIGQNDSLLNGLKQNGPDSNMENNFVNNLSRPQDVNGQMNVLGYSGIKGQYGNKNNVLPNELTEETHQDAADDCDVHITDSSLKESVSGSHKGGFSVDQMKDITCEFTHVDSCHEGMLSNAIETGGGEKFHPTFNAKNDSSSKHSQSNLYTENGSVNCDKGNISFMRVNHSMDAINYPKHPSSSKLGIASSELSYQTPFSCDVEVSLCGSSETSTALSLSNDNDIPSSLCKDNMACKSTITDSVVDEKMRNLSLDEQVEVKKEDESLGEDCTSFISELHDTGGSLFLSHLNQPVQSEFVESNESSEGDVATSHSQQFHPPGDEFLNDDSSAMFSVPVDAFKTTYEYDPSAWTPMEFETATGNADCMVMEHPLKLRSTYAEIEDCSGTRDPNGEPLVTSYNRCFSGTVDYIWRSEGLQTVKVLAPIPKHAMQWTPGFPTKKWGSDHIALVCELAFTEDTIIQKTETL